MVQEYWMKYKTDRKKVETYLIAQGLPKDGKDLIIKSEKGGVDCWLSWHGTRLDNHGRGSAPNRLHRCLHSPVDAVWTDYGATI